MKSVLAILLACCGIVLTVKERAAAQLGRDPIPLAQVPETWLMLKNGSTFSARMLSAGERVKLRVNEGDIEVRASEIALTGYSLGDLAEQQWALLHQQQLDKQFPFIDWCARYHLYDHAEAALAQMAIVGQDVPRIKGYQIRLARLREIHQEELAAAAQLAAAPPASVAPTAQSLPASPAVIAAAPQLPAPPQPAVPPPAVPAPNVAVSLAPAPAHLLPAQSLNPATALRPATGPMSSNSAVQQAAYQPSEPLTIPKAATLNSPNAKALPPAAVELFAERVQPWVVSRCSNIGCHDMTSANSFKLERYSKQEAIPRATTLKNLAATARLILADKPEESPLLVMSSRAHGTSITPPVAAGDGAALAAFREFVALATGRDLPKEIKPDPASSNSHNNTPGQVTPGRATFPASAADEPAPDNKSAAVINQNSAGWQAAIERQRAYDAEAQKLKNLETSSQRANEARGLLDPAVKPAAVAADIPTTQTPATAMPPSQEPRSELLLPSNKAEATLLTPAIPETKTVILESLPQTKASAMPESLLPKSIAKAKSKAENLPAQEEAQAPPATGPLLKPSATTLPVAPAASKEAAPPINLNRPRRRFPLPPEDTPPPQGVGTTETKRR